MAEAAQLAARLANEDCQKRYRRRPFTPDQYDVVLDGDHYRWGKMEVGGRNGFSALVTFRKDGTSPSVEVYFTTDMLTVPVPENVIAP